MTPLSHVAAHSAAARDDASCDDASCDDAGILTEATAKRALRETRWDVVAADPLVVRAVRRAVGARAGRLRRVTAAQLTAPPSGHASRGVVAAVAVVEADAGGAWHDALRAARATGVPAVVIDNDATLARAVAALAAGACDYVTGPLDTVGTSGDLRGRLARVASRALADVHTGRRMNRLRSAVRHLGAARRQVASQVEVLCHDYIDGFGEVARQVEEVRLATHLRSLLAGAADLEQLLCHTMDWLLRHAGHCNIAIFLDDDAGGTELGAYMKHTVPGEPSVVAWLQRHVVPLVAREGGEVGGAGVVRCEPERLLADLDVLDKHAAGLMDHVVLGVRCVYLGESLATVLLTRRDDEPLTAHAERVLRLAGDAFAHALTGVVRRDDKDGNGDKQQADAVDAADDRDADAGEWWQRGDAAPY